MHTIRIPDALYEVFREQAKNDRRNTTSYLILALEKLAGTLPVPAKPQREGRAYTYEDYWAEEKRRAEVAASKGRTYTPGQLWTEEKSHAEVAASKPKDSAEWTAEDVARGYRLEPSGLAEGSQEVIDRILRENGQKS